MDTIGMDSYPFIAAAAAAVIVVPEQDRVLLVARRVNDGLEMSHFYGLKLNHLVFAQRFGQCA